MTVKGRRVRRLALVAIGVATVATVGQTHGVSAAATCGTPRVQGAWCDTSQSPDQRADLLERQMTEAQKISMLAGSGTANNSRGGLTAAIPSLGIPAAEVSGGPMGDNVAWDPGQVTQFPSGMAEAATFDPQMAYVQGQITANELYLHGGSGLLAPTDNMMRTPLGGRTFESFGEDPYLASQTTVANVDGVQSSGKVFATVKQYIANDQEGQGDLALEGADGGRLNADAIVDDRTLHEIDLAPFEAAVNAGVGAVMCAYNRINVAWSCANQYVLNNILKRQLGYHGLVMSDWDFGTDHPQDTSNELNNGLDLEMPMAISYQPDLVTTALTSGTVSQATIEDHVHRILRTLFAFGLFDRPRTGYPDLTTAGGINAAGHAQDALHVEESAITLLQNQGNILPLDASSLHTVAIIGPDAGTDVAGGGSSSTTPYAGYTVTPKQAIASKLGAGATVRYDNGTDLATSVTDATGADVALVFVGDAEAEGVDNVCMDLACTVPSASDPTPSNQDALISAVAAANPNTIVVLQTGGPTLTPWRTQVRGVLDAWYPGEQGGKAIANVLFGAVDPSGRSPVTFPQKASDEQVGGDPVEYPGVGLEEVYGEGVMVGYRWFDRSNFKPAFAFGSGLSYSTSKFSNLQIHQADPATGSVADVTVDVTNTGNRTAHAVPEVYLGLPSIAAASPGPPNAPTCLTVPNAPTTLPCEPATGTYFVATPSGGTEEVGPPADEISVPQPPHQLKGYTKVSLAPGQSTQVTLPLNDRAFSYWDVTSQNWKVAPGCYAVFLGSSDADLPLTGTISRSGANCGPGAVAISAQPTVAVPETPATWLLAPTGALAAAAGLPLLVARRRRRLGRSRRDA